MTQTLAAGIEVALVSHLVDTLDLSNRENRTRFARSWAFANGVGADQADRVWHDRRTLAASAAENLDLSGGLTDVFGATITLARLKALVLYADPGNTNLVQLTRPSSNGVPLFLAASDGLALRPGGAFCWVSPDATGIVVTAGTGDLLTVTNSAGGTSVTYDVLLLGASA